MGDKLYPKIAIFDLTAIGDYSATGQIKKNLFGEWPQANILGISGAYGENVKILINRKRVDFTLEAAFAEVANFNPDLIFYRPVPENQVLHDFAMNIIKSLDRPLVTWIVDDWPSSLKENNPVLFEKMDQDFRHLLSQSIWNYSISDSMSESFGKRYGVDFESLANGVVPAEWVPVSKPPLENRTFKIRYAGGLAENMNRASFIRLANSVEALSKHINVKLEILTKPHWWETIKDQVGHYKSIKVELKSRSPNAYRNWLKNADCVVILYNFDEMSIKYIADSFANKLPECLASGSPLLMHGPSAAATIRYMEGQDCAVIVNEPSEDKLKAAITKLMKNDKEQKRLIENARSLAFENHNLNVIRNSLYSNLKSIASRFQKTSKFNSFDRQKAASLNETNIIFELSNHSGPKTMIDVGGHTGTSSRAFAKKKWNIIAFEPDPDNRQLFAKSLGHMKNVILDPRAVGEKAESNVAFYNSSESTGISGMLAFRDSHKQSTTVDVTTIENIVIDKNLEKIDFLKIDAEGYDFSVLKGIPWDVLHPEIIECEFEDFKTQQLGHSWRDMCNYLLARGYSVYLSEWHPIIRYGISHDWHTMHKYPCELNNQKAWGNILAFKQDPGEVALSKAIDKALQFPRYGVEPQSGTKNENNDMSEVSNHLNKPIGIGRRLREKSPALFRVAQFGKWSLDFFRRHLFASIVALLLIGFGLLSPIYISGFSPYKWPLWSFSLAVVLGMLAMVSIAFANMMAQRLAIRESTARAELKAEILQDMQKLHTDTDVFRELVEEKIDSRIIEENKSRKKSNDRLSARIRHNNDSARRLNEKLESKLNQVEAEKTQLQARLGTLMAQLKNLQANEIETLKSSFGTQVSEMRKLTSNLASRMETESKQSISGFEQSVKKLEGRLEQVNEQFNLNKNKSSEEITKLKSGLKAEVKAEVELLNETHEASLNIQVNKLNELQAEISSINELQESSFETHGKKLNEIYTELKNELKAEVELLNETHEASLNIQVNKLNRLQAEISSINELQESSFETQGKKLHEIYTELKDELVGLSETQVSSNETNTHEMDKLQAELNAEIIRLNESIKPLKDMSNITNKIGRRVDQAAVSMMENSQKISEFDKEREEFREKLTSLTEKMLSSEFVDVNKKQKEKLKAWSSAIKSQMKAADKIQADNIESLKSTLGGQVETLEALVSEMSGRMDKESKRNSTSFARSIEQLEERLDSLKADRSKNMGDTEKITATFQKSLAEVLAEVKQLKELKKTTDKNKGAANALGKNLADVVAEVEHLKELKITTSKMKRRIDQTAVSLSNHSMETDESKKFNATLQKNLAEVAAEVEQLKLLKETTNEIKRRVDETALNMLETSSKISKFDKNISKFDKNIDELGRKLSSTERVIAEEQAKAGVSYHHFNRVLKPQHVNEIQNNWLKPLNLNETKRSLAYAADRINIVEQNLKGRLATSLENALLRTIVAKAVKGKKLRVLEVGVLFGVGLAIIHEIAGDGFESVHYTAIDPLEGYYGNNVPDLITHAKVNRQNLLQNMELAKISPQQFTLLEGFSTDDDVVEAASKKLYDLLIIDGDHSYAGVKADFVNFAPFVKRGGYIIIDDDSTPEWPKITEYVDVELMPRQDIVLIGRSWRSAVFQVIKKVKI